MVAVRYSFFPLQLGLDCATVSRHASLWHVLLPFFCSLSPHLWPRDGHASLGHIAVSRGCGRRWGVGGGGVRAQEVGVHVLPVLVFVLLEQCAAQQHWRGLFIRGVGRIVVRGAEGRGGDGAGGRRRRWGRGEADGETREKTSVSVGCDGCTSSSHSSILTTILIILIQLRVRAGAVARVVQTVISTLDSEACWQKVLSQRGSAL